MKKETRKKINFKNLNKKSLCILVIAIIIILVIITILINVLKKDKSTDEYIMSNTSTESFVVTSGNGEKTNISSKIKEDKEVEGLTFSNLQVTMKNNETVVTGKVSNNTKDSIKGFYFKLTAINEYDETTATAEGLLDSEIPSGKSTTFESTTSKDFANCYDIRIEKIKDAD